LLAAAGSLVRFKYRSALYRPAAHKTYPRPFNGWHEHFSADVRVCLFVGLLPLKALPYQRVGSMMSARR
jgi:hypothetical protein